MDNVLKNKKKNSFLYFKNIYFLFLLNALIFCVLAYLLPIRFEVNDDVVMTLIASGAYSGTPDAHLVFINYLYGLLVSSLYLLTPAIEWYAVLFSGIHVLSISVILWKILNAQVSSFIKLVFFCLFWILEAYLILNFQFTTTTALCALAGLVLFLSDKAIERTVGIILFILASLLRFEAAFLVMAVLMPLLLHYIYLHRSERKVLIGLMTLMIVIPFCAKLVDSYIYRSDKDWAEYKEYNVYRGKINDNPNAAFLSDLPQSISQSDYYLLLGFFADTNIINKNVVEEIYSDINEVHYTKSLYNIYRNVKRYEVYIILLCSVLVVLMIFCKSKENRIVLLLLFLSFGVLASYISIAAVFKQRVFLSMILPLFWGIFVVLKNEKPSSYKTILSILPITFICIFLVKDIALRRTNLLYHMYRYVAQEEIILEKEKTVVDNQYIIPFVASFKPEHRNPFYLTKIYPHNKYVLLGWLSTIPFNKGRVDSFRDFVDKNMLILPKETTKSSPLDLIKTSIKSNYNITVDSEVFIETGEFMLVRLKSKQTQN